MTSFELAVRFGQPPWLPAGPAQAVSQASSSLERLGVSGLPESAGRIVAALTAFVGFATPSRISRALMSGDSLREAWRELPSQTKIEVEADAERLLQRGIEVMFLNDADYPAGLRRRSKPVAPILFYLGSREQFHTRGIGMCGSRAVSALGLKAARACGVAVSHNNLTVVSGYAKGVDTETHLAALQEGGRTTIVLAEGINHFRVKRNFADDFDPTRVLVVSQFPPSQPWRSFAAMSRNDVIIGLSDLLIVIEAGEKGGTRAAGESALANGEPVVVLDFGDATPPGNRHLLDQGASAVHSVTGLSARLDALTASRIEEPKLW